jgi:hypothetical protein
MELHRLGVKFFAAEAAAFPIRDCVPVFHSWIQQQAIPGHLLIDVHDYSHVHQGPGILLVAHEGNFSLDQAEGRLGLYYYRKTAGQGDFETQLHDGFASALRACSLLEREAALTPRLQFFSDEAVVVFNDRLAAANDDKTFTRLQPAVARVASRIWPGPVNIEAINPNTQERLSMRVRASLSGGVNALVARL